MTGSGTRRGTLVVTVVFLVLWGTIAPAAGLTVTDVGVDLEDPADAAEVDVADDLEETIDDALENGSETVEIVVRFEEETPPPGADLEDELESHATETQADLIDYVDETAGIEVTNQFWLTNAVLLEVDPAVVDLETLAAFDDVTELHGNFEVSTPEPPSSAESTDDEPGETTGYRTTGGLAHVGAPGVWEAHGTKGEGVKVAVLDTGIDADHPDLSLSTDDPADPTYPGGWAEFDETGAKLEGSTPYDSASHGTHVSGTVAGGNASGVHVGVAPEADLAHGLVLHDDRGTFAQIVAGLEWAVEIDADVINASFGIDGTYDGFVEPVRNARHGGVLVVGAIGNGGAGTSTSPGNLYDTLSVGAVDSDERVAGFSGGEELTAANWTEPPDDWPETYAVPDLVAPGVDVESTVPGGEYDRMPGTSMATPHVAGTAALLLSIDGELGPDDVEDVLLETARTPSDGAVEDDGRYGHGIVDAVAAADAVEAARADVGGGDAELETAETSEEAAPAADGMPGYGAIAALVSISLLLASRTSLTSRTRRQ